MSGSGNFNDLCSFAIFNCALIGYCSGFGAVGYLGSGIPSMILGSDNCRISDLAAMDALIFNLYISAARLIRIIAIVNCIEVIR